MRRETANVLLLLFGGALVKIAIDGTCLRYVKPSAVPWVLAGGVVVVGLAVVGIARDMVGSVGGHEHSGGWGWLLILPVLTIFVIAPGALGADSVLRDGGRAELIRPATAEFAPLPRRGTARLGISDFVARAVWDSGSLAGRTVALVGFVVHDGGNAYVARLVITCCAADATPMKVALTGRQAAALPDDQWVRVTGKLRPGSATTTDGYTPTIDVASLVVVDAPADPYEY